MVINVVEAEVGLVPQAIASVKNFADETVIIDMSTIGVGGGKGIKVYKHKHVDWVEPVRNFGVEKAKGDWILIIDPDEEVSSSLAKKLKAIVKKPGADYYRLPRKNIIFSKWVKHSRWWPDYNIRFFKKGNVSWSEVIHAVPMTTGKGIDLEAKEGNAIVHYHYDSIDEYLKKMTRYTTQHAKLKIKEGYQFKWRDLVRKPVSEFLSRYFFGRAYRDGIHGLALSGLQALSEFVLYLKIWEFQKKFKERSISLGKVINLMKQTEKEFHYWQADAQVAEGAGLKAKVKRKLKI